MEHEETLTAAPPLPKVSAFESRRAHFTEENSGQCPKAVANRGKIRAQREILAESVNVRLFWAKVDRRDLFECWEWTASKNGKGYGTFAINKKTVLAHRVSVVLSGREIPEGMLADHECHNRACVNPAHLRVATPKQNGENTAEAEKTHCIHGHEYTTANTIRKNGMRNCRACHNASKNRSRTEMRRKARFAWIGASP